MEIIRKKELELLTQRFRYARVVAILGPRQCGKTTLARQFVRLHSQAKIHFFDLEDETHLARLDNPSLTLGPLTGYVIIDEIQRRPELFPALRVLVDRQPSTRYLILGSASRDLLAQSSESLAGRISYMEMEGFSLDELPDLPVQKLWFRGGFPRSFLAENDAASFDWRHDFVTTFLERDVPRLGFEIPPKTLRRFWMMLAHYHAQLFNASEIGQSLASSDSSMKRYLDLLSGTFLMRQIQPWSYNTKKRLIKRPKVYFRDSGIFHTLLSLKRQDDLFSHPKLGASWEGFALEQTILHLNLKEEEIFFWGTHSGAELDMLFQDRGRLWGVEAKFNEAPTLTKSMLSAISELSLAHLWVVHPGKESYPLHKRISTVSLKDLNSLKTTGQRRG